MTYAFPTRRNIALLLALCVAASLAIAGFTADPAHASAVTRVASARPASPAEATFTSRLNGARTQRGLPRLTVRAALVSVARAQAARMANRAVLYHNPNLTTDVHNWRWVGENVGYGPNAPGVHAAFMNSKPHRDNILDRDYTEIGIGTVLRDGRVWVAEVFRRPMHAASLAAGFRDTLRVGSTGTAVRRVQARLGLHTTGRYGVRTRAAVAGFQRHQGWAGKGRVGVRTWQRLF